MIARIWRGRAVGANAAAYQRHVTQSVFPTLPALAGHRGAYLLRRETGEGTEFLAVTLWDSLAAIRAFAGEDAERAVVEPGAREVLADFDAFVRHYEVVHGPACAGSEEAGRK
ncbi:MAG TPA: antibiotic biosynthesis monooxygenase [Alphaproteobacteria bacterium]|nr:antibiotic biosynthesis monooxygenase [Alphaproteobacteria bacterium]